VLSKITKNAVVVAAASLSLLLLLCQGVQHPANISLKDLLVRIGPQLIISQLARYFGVQVGPVAHLDPRGPRRVRYEDVVRSSRRLG
jgi:hypothetical protein